SLGESSLAAMSRSQDERARRGIEVAPITRRASAASSARASMAGGVTCSGKALVSQCAPETPIGVTSRQKALRYQRTGQSVLNRGVGRPALNYACAGTRFYVFMSGQHGAS